MSEEQFTIKQIVSELLASGEVTIGCLHEKHQQEYVRKAVIKEKHAQESALHEMGLLPLSEKQRLRFTWDSEAGTLKMKLTAPMKFTVLN